MIGHHLSKVHLGRLVSQSQELELSIESKVTELFAQNKMHLTHSFLIQGKLSGSLCRLQMILQRTGHFRQPHTCRN